MLLPLYMLFAIFAIMFFLLGIFKREVIILPWLAVILIFPLALLSANIENQYCEGAYNETNISAVDWDCHVENYEDLGLLWYWRGLGIMMFAFAVLNTVIRPVEELSEQSESLSM